MGAFWRFLFWRLALARFHFSFACAWGTVSYAGLPCIHFLHFHEAWYFSKLTMFSDYQRAGPRGKFICASMENLTGVAFLYGKLHGGAIRMGRFTGVVLLHVTALTRPQP